MNGWFDALTLGPARRRRRLERQLRGLEREYAAWAGGTPTGERKQDRDVTAWVALLVAVVGLVGVVVAVPEVVPEPARRLLGLGPDRLADAPAASGRGTYAFMAHQRGDPSAPVTYDPCRAIRVRVNTEDGPPGAVDLVREAMAEVSEATGLVLEYAGPTTERPNWESASLPSFFGRVQARPVLVSWADDDEVPQLAGDVAGIGGSVSIEDADGFRRYVTGGVTLDEHSFDELAEQSDGKEQMRAIVLHELGHLVGLAHVDDPRELMHADNVGRLDFGTGDRTGLALVGSGRCS